MNGNEQLQYLSWALYLLIFAAVVSRAIGRPTRAHLDMALFFGATTLIILLTVAPTLLRQPPPDWLSDATGALLLALPFLLLRLVADFTRVPTWVTRGSAFGLALSVVAIVLVPKPMPAAVAMLLVLFFLVVIAYDTAAFARQARVTRGVTQRRMEAIALGSLFLGLVLLDAGLSAALPGEAGVWSEMSTLAGLFSGVAYFVGFVPPTWLRRAWQEPELRALLSRAASLPRLPTTDAILHELERGMAASLGAPSATIGLWDATAGVLRFRSRTQSVAPGLLENTSFTLHDGVWEVDPVTHPISGQAFAEQQAILVQDAPRLDPKNADVYRAFDARAVLAAPITAGDQRLGVLMIYAPRAPVFANSDLELVQLLADQAAVILESRKLIDEAARVRAREEVTRLKDDFLSSAAHDLKTPLTSIIAQADLLKRRAEREPGSPADSRGIERIIAEGKRLRTLVLDLLDVSRLEQGGLLGEREPVDLFETAREVCAREELTQGRCTVEGDTNVVGMVDPVRIQQLLENLIENAVKYSPSDTYVQVRVWREGQNARLSVTDRGIGIPAEDMGHVFDRFHRGSNVDDRRFAGMGLGLYICRGIVEQHGGSIWAENVPGGGTTFHVALPLAAIPLAGATKGRARQAHV